MSAPFSVQSESDERLAINTTFGPINQIREVMTLADHGACGPSPSGSPSPLVSECPHALGQETWLSIVGKLETFLTCVTVSSGYSFPPLSQPPTCMMPSDSFIIILTFYIV